MTLIAENLTLDCHDWPGQVAFWSALLGYADDPENPNEPGDPMGLIVGPAGGPSLLCVPVPEAKTVKNRLHLDLRPVGTTRDAEVERALGLGATLVDDRRAPDGTGWAVLADPEGNEFCIERGAAERAAERAAGNRPAGWSAQGGTTRGARSTCVGAEEHVVGPGSISGVTRRSTPSAPRRVVVMTETSSTPSVTTAPTGAAYSAPTGVPGPPPAGPRLLLRRRDRLLGGVASGIAGYTGLPTLLVRLLFVASGFMGWGLLLYPVLWVVVPDERAARRV